MVAQPVGVCEAMLLLQTLVVLGRCRVLVLCVLLVVVQQVWHPTTRPIQAGIVALLVILRVHACRFHRSIEPGLLVGMRSCAIVRICLCNDWFKAGGMDTWCRGGCGRTSPTICRRLARSLEGLCSPRSPPVNGRLRSTTGGTAIEGQAGMLAFAHGPYELTVS